MPFPDEAQDQVNELLRAVVPERILRLAGPQRSIVGEHDAAGHVLDIGWRTAVVERVIAVLAAGDIREVEHGNIKAVHFHPLLHLQQQPFFRQHDDAVVIAGMQQDGQERAERLARTGASLDHHIVVELRLRAVRREPAALICTEQVFIVLRVALHSHYALPPIIISPKPLTPSARPNSTACCAVKNVSSFITFSSLPSGCFVC